MEKHTILATFTLLTLSLAFSVPLVFAGYNNSNGINGYQGTNRASNQLPDQSNVPWPSGIVEDIFAPGSPHVVEGCRAQGPTVIVSVPGLGDVPGGPCCKGPQITEGLYAPNQCCNPPDIAYPNPDDWTPGNHCLCFVMRLFPLT
jgi:hypothetical protein